MDGQIVHFLAGGTGGTVAAILTSPLEVVKTRLQSSVATFGAPVYLQKVATVPRHAVNLSTCAGSISTSATAAAQPTRVSLGLFYCLKHIVVHEGPRALFKGLGPNIVGVAPSRAIYFFSYAKTKKLCNNSHILTPDTPLVHILSASSAGFTACTLTNPIWFVKTRLQLDQKAKGSLTTKECIKDIFRVHGLTGFYKGITASYFGISETVIHFVIYEAIKARLLVNHNGDNREAMDFVHFMFAGACSKTCASIIAYPHEVARTRLRQEGDKYRSFFQTLRTVFHEEGYRGLYRGLVTQLVRQIPNTAIMMSTYEAVVYLLSPSNVDDDDDDYDG